MACAGDGGGKMDLREAVTGTEDVNIYTYFCRVGAIITKYK